ncbi:MAG: histone deacetylase family protein [Actinobacteria bacterium]|nr:histone deacetylase family protein [Actinomycetota bacterium]
MALEMPVVWSESCLLHEPGGEVWIGLPDPGNEVPARAEAIRAALGGAGARLVPAEPHEDDALLAVHDAELVDFLRDAWQLWRAAGYPDDPGQPRVVPYIFPHRGLLAGLEPSVPAAMSARTGMFAFDTMTPIGEQTWEAARAAVDVALTAADLVLDGAPAAYACTRPPGHHVTRSAYGGSCYLNSTAIAAQYLRDRGMTRVAIVDVDAHQGNGAQAIFAGRNDVLTGSVHVDPRAGWFPHFVGFEDESDSSNRNLPLAPGSGDDDWLAGVGELARWVEDVDALVLALGVDAAEADPTGPLRVTAAGFREGGRILGALGLPTVVVQEGGYVLETVGDLVLAALTGMEEGRVEGA